MGKKCKSFCIFCGENSHKWEKCRNKPSSQCDHDDHKAHHCSLTLLEQFNILEHDVVHNKLHKPKAWVDDFVDAIEKAYVWFYKHGESTHNVYLHLNLIKELHEKTQNLHELLHQQKFLTKLLRAWHTVAEEWDGYYSSQEDNDDHDEHGNGRNEMEIGAKREDPMSQESQGESPSSTMLTSCTINQSIVGQIPSIFDGELHNFDAVNDDDDIDLLVDYHEMDQENNFCNFKVNECFNELCDETLKQNDDELSLLVDDENDVINAFVSSLALEEDFCFSHDIEAMTNQNEVLHEEIFRQQISVFVSQPNLKIQGVFYGCLLEAMLCDGICVSIHTIGVYVKHDGACMLIHARKSDDVVILSKLMLICVHNDAKILWLFLIVSLAGDLFCQMWYLEVQIESRKEVHLCTNSMELMFLNGNVLTRSIALQIEAKAHNVFEEVCVDTKVCFWRNVDTCLQNNEAYFEVIGSKTESTQWSGDVLITLWFYKFVLYELSWMMIYLMGSQPWHVAIKWCNCNSLCVRGCTKWASTVNLCGGKGWCLVALYGVCCVSWINFQPLHFALYFAINT